jgi:biopolymer transport protein ExbD
VFLLLLFFVMNGTISNIQDFRIELPKTTELTSGGNVTEAAYISDRNVLTFRGAPATGRSIAEAWLSEDAPGRKLAPFLVIADRRLPALDLMARLEEMKAAGLLSLTLVTVREAANAE